MLKVNQKKVLWLACLYPRDPVMAESGVWPVICGSNYQTSVSVFGCLALHDLPVLKVNVSVQCHQGMEVLWGFLLVFDFWRFFGGFWSLVCDRNLAATFSKKTYKSLLEHLLIIVIYPKVSKIYQIPPSPSPKSGWIFPPLGVTLEDSGRMSIWERYCLSNMELCGTKQQLDTFFRCVFNFWIHKIRKISHHLGQKDIIFWGPRH